MEHRKLGTQGLVVSAVGLGCMGMSQSYGAADDTESIAAIHRALDLGVTFLDTAEVYGPFVNEKLVGRALRGRRDEAVVATKFGFKIDPAAANPVSGVDGSPANVKRAAEACLGRLGIETIDLFYQHRRDPNVPIEETVGALKELIEAGKIRYIGLSEVGAETLRRAHNVHPVSALQSEYSLWERGLETDIIPTLRELGIGLVPFSPLGRGFLTGAVASNEGLPEDDFRHRDPRFALENAKQNAAIVAGVKEIAAAHDATPAQVALAWLLAKGDDVVPIPGTKRVRYLEENARAAELALSAPELARLDGLAAITAGPRYNEAMMSMVER
jgi:aryl-alcohol dehydrogenase-like predicted oxidoreductase